MKNLLLTKIMVVSFWLSSVGQNVQYNFENYAIGQNASGAAICNEGFVPEIIKLGTTYYLYYTHKYTTTLSAISYATSTDLVNWTVVDTIFTGSPITTNPEYVFGGARVIKLSSGNYRMFYRCAEEYTLPAEPKYHIRSAISSDGINFTKEGIRIPIEAFTPGSYFTHVGHSEFYHDQGGNVVALLTAKDTTMTAMEPDRIYSAISFDEGITWGTFVPLYTGCHDPVVVIDSTGLYHAFFSFYDSGFRTVTSANGAIWPSTPDTLYLMQSGSALTESSYPKIADLGAAVANDGSIIIYSNHQTVMGPWTNVAYYFFGGYLGQHQSKELEQISLYPNPAASELSVIIENNKYTSCQVYDIAGKVVLNQEVHGNSMTVDVSNITNGFYVLKLQGESDFETRTFVVEH